MKKNISCKLTQFSQMKMNRRPDFKSTSIVQLTYSKLVCVKLKNKNDEIKQGGNEKKVEKFEYDEI